MPVELGHFVYENAGTGCLLSKYCNANIPGDAPLTESASRIHRDPNFPNDPFCGEFLATWVENPAGLQTQSSRLIITRKQTNGSALEDRYTLTWQDLATPATPRFYGEAMLFNNLLIGAYR